jgi:hypothetical protein
VAKPLFEREGDLGDGRPKRSFSSEPVVTSTLGLPRGGSHRIPTLEFLRGACTMRCCACFFMRIVSRFQSNLLISLIGKFGVLCRGRSRARNWLLGNLHNGATPLQTESTCFHRNPRWFHVLAALPNSARCCSEASFFGHFAGLIHHAVMTSLVTQIDANGRRSN